MRKNEQLTGSEGSDNVCVETTNCVIIFERRYDLPPIYLPYQTALNPVLTRSD